MNPAAGSNVRPRIFVSYRRQDSEAAVGRLVDDLRRALPGNPVFQDWASIAPGEDFVVALERELANCAAALVVIGPRWLSAADAAGKRRLDDPDDWVRREIAECLARDELRLFPLLVDGARMPNSAELPEAIRALGRRQAYPIVNRHWAKDLAALVDILRNVPGLHTGPGPMAAAPLRGTGDGRAAPASVSSTGDGGSGPPGAVATAGRRWALIGAVGVAIAIGLLIANSGRERPPRLPAENSVPAMPDQGPLAERAPQAAAERTLPAGEVFRDCDECPEMVVVPAGELVMGSPELEEGRAQGEGPQHRVRIEAPFAVGKYEVTFTEWDACVSAGGCSHRPDDEAWGRGRRPVINVSWNDAQEFVNWLADKTGLGYRLPSEAEWEYAARAGNKTSYPWGDFMGRNKANFHYSGSDWSGSQTAPVGQFEANRFGLHDMIGNVWEWVADCWHDGYEGAPEDGRAWTSGECSQRVVRGGSWVNLAFDARAAVRGSQGAGERHHALGFRPARPL